MTATVSDQRATRQEMMVIAAARALSDGEVCFVGIGAPSTAANVARRLHAPDLVLVYESGCIGAKPANLPLSIGDGELADTADVVVSVPEIFNYWLQPGRINVGFLGAAQIDRYVHLNTTVLGSYDRPAVRLPGAGGAPEIAACCPRAIVMIGQSRRTFVDSLDFRTSTLGGRGPHLVVTDLGVLRPDPVDGELVLTELHPGVTVEEAREATGWPLRVASEVGEAPGPTGDELSVLRALSKRRGGEST